MKSILSIIMGLTFVSAVASAETTKTIDGAPSAALYQALIQADLPYQEDNDGVTVRLRSTKCSIANAYTDNVPRGSCTSIRGTASAVAIANALIGIGVSDDGGMSHIRPEAKNISCVAKVLEDAPWLTYTCTLTAEFIEN